MTQVRSAWFARPCPFSPEQPPWAGLVSVLQGTHVEGVVGGKQNALPTPQRGLELMSHPAGVLLAFQRTSTPLGRKRMQFLERQIIDGRHRVDFRHLPYRMPEKNPASAAWNEADSRGSAGLTASCLGALSSASAGAARGASQSPANRDGQHLRQRHTRPSVTLPVPPMTRARP